jgi:hypothetical protein
MRSLLVALVLLLGCDDDPPRNRCHAPDGGYQEGDKIVDCEKGPGVGGDR